MPDPNFATNLRRLLLFEHKTAKEAAESLGATPATVSRWLTGKRYPSAEALITIETLYGVSPREIDGDPTEFAQVLADPERIAYAADQRGKHDVSESLTMRHRRRAQKERQNVVPITKGRKS